MVGNDIDHAPNGNFILMVARMLPEGLLASICAQPDLIMIIVLLVVPMSPRLPLGSVSR